MVRREAMQPRGRRMHDWMKIGPCQRFGGEHPGRRIDAVHLNHALGQIDPYPYRAFSDNLVQSTSPFIGCRLMTSNTTTPVAPSPLPEDGKCLRIPFKRTGFRRVA